MSLYVFTKKSDNEKLLTEIRVIDDSTDSKLIVSVEPDPGRPDGCYFKVYPNGKTGKK